MRTLFFPGNVKLMTLGGLLIFILFSCTGTRWMKSSDGSGNRHEKIAGSQAMRDEATDDEGVVGAPVSAERQEYILTRNPKTGEVPLKSLWDSWQYGKSLRDVDGTSPSDIAWEERGPSNVGGRTRAIMFDPNDGTHRKVWAGSVSGGLWFTSDITADPPVWHKVDDFWERLPVGCLAYDPTNTQIFYAGTGEGWGGWGHGQGVGIYRSTDGGATWDTITSTFMTANFMHVLDLAVHPVTGYVYAATRGYNGNSGGILRSKDHGTTWEVVLNKSTAPTASLSNRGADLEIASDNYLYATMGVHDSGGIFRSTTGNAGDWTTIQTGIDILSTHRIELAVSQSSPATLYCMIQDTTTKDDIYGFFKSTNRGSNWTPVTIPMRNATTSIAKGQADYDMILNVHPVNPNLVYAGGVVIFKTTDGGASWAEVPGIHDDHHAIVTRPGFSDELVFGNDGGVYYTADCTEDPPEILNKNNGYNVTQFYTVAYHPNCHLDYFLGGTQDNGTPRFENPGINATTQATGADGAYCHINQDNSRLQLTGKQWNRYCRSRDFGATFDEIGQGKVANWLIPPAVYDDAHEVLYASYNKDSLLRVRDYMGDFVFEYLPGLNLGETPSAITLVPDADDRLLLGTAEGRIFRIENASDPTGWSISEWNTAALPDGAVASFDFGPNSSQVLVVFSNFGIPSVWETLDNGDHWYSKEGNLPDMPVRWGIYNPYDYRQVLLATEIGVWTTEDVTVANPAWVPCNGGLANVRVNRLELRKSDMTLFAATFGRGIFTSTSLNAIAQQKVTAGDGAVDSYLGCSVDIFGNYAIAGAFGDNGKTGAAYIFKFNGNQWQQMQKLTAINGKAFDMFGYSVALDGEYAVIGAFGDQDNGTKSGAAYVFKRDGETWSQQAKIKPSDGAAEDRFGGSVSKYGDYIAVGSSLDDDIGAVYLFKRSGAMWNQTCKIVPEPGVPANFGLGNSLLKDTLVVGSPGTSADKGYVGIYTRDAENWKLVKDFTDWQEGSAFGQDVTGMNGLYAFGAWDADNPAADNAGGAYPYESHPGGWTGGTIIYPPYSWSFFRTGYSVDMLNEYLIMGSLGDWDVDGSGGSVSLYRYLDHHWGFFLKLFPADLEESDGFGTDVALSAQYAMIGSPYDENEMGSDAGAVYFFRNYASGRSQPELSVTPMRRDVGSSHASVNLDVHNIGTGLMQWTATPNDPWLTITGGATGTDDGTVHVAFTENTYCQRAGTVTIDAPGALDSPKTVEITQTASGTEEEIKIVPESMAGGDYSGYSVAVDGSVAVIGNYGDDDKGSQAGSLSLYEYNGTTWVKKATLYAPDPAAGDFFGYDVAISGDVVVAGAHGKNSAKGVAYVFVRPAGGWQSMSATARLTASDGAANDDFGKKVAVTGEYIAVASHGHNQGAGAVYFFDRPAGGWTASLNETVHLTPHHLTGGANFGSDVALSGEFAVVGASNDDGKGSAYIFRNAWSWTEYARITASDGAAGDGFGKSVDIRGDHIICGADGADGARGSAYIFKRPPVGWCDMTETWKVTAPDRAPSDYFGISVGIHDHNALVGAYYDDDHGSASGSAYGYIINDTTVWLEEKLTASDGSAADYYGHSVGISYQYSVVGAYGDDDKGSLAGAAYIYCNSCETVCTPEMALSPSGTVSVPATSGNQAVSITNPGNCTFNWRCRPSAGWLTVSGDSTGTSPGSVTVHYAANPGNARTGTVSLLSADAFNAPVTLTFSQAHGPDIELETDSVKTGESVCWFASGSVTITQTGGSFVVANGGQATVASGGRILIRPFTHAENGSFFHAYIGADPCPPPSAPAPGAAPEEILTGHAPYEVNATGKITLFPNPADWQVSVLLPQPVAGKHMVIELYDVMGKNVMKWTYPVSPLVKLETTSLSPAVYLLKVRIDECREMTGKLVIQRR